MEREKSMDIEQLKKEIEALEIEGANARAATTINADTKLSVLWAKVGSLIGLLQLSGFIRKGSNLDRYANALKAAMEKIIEREEEEEPEPES